MFDYKNKIFSIFLTFFLIIMSTQAQITFNEILENQSDLDLNLMIGTNYKGSSRTETVDVRE